MKEESKKIIATKIQNDFDIPEGWGYFASAVLGVILMSVPLIAFAAKGLTAGLVVSVVVLIICLAMFGDYIGEKEEEN